MEIKQDMSAGLNRKWILEVNTEELQNIASALDCGAENMDYTAGFRKWCRMFADKIFKIFDK
jgi:hypothetical protein